MSLPMTYIKFMAANTKENFNDLIQKLHSEVLSNAEITELVSSYENVLLVEDLIALSALPDIPRDAAFKLSRICIINGLAKEPVQAIEQYLVGTIYGIEVQIYFDAILAAEDAERLVNFYWNEENPPHDLAIQIAGAGKIKNRVQYPTSFRTMKLHLEPFNESWLTLSEDNDNDGE